MRVQFLGNCIISSHSVHQTITRINIFVEWIRNENIDTGVFCVTYNKSKSSEIFYLLKYICKIAIAHSIYDAENKYNLIFEHQEQGKYVSFQHSFSIDPGSISNELLKISWKSDAGFF